MTTAREEFLNATDFKIKACPLGTSKVHVRTLSLNRLKELRAYESRDDDADERKNRAAVGLATLALCDADGNFLFDLEDVNKVSGKTPDTVVAIANAAADVQAGAEDVAAAKKDSKGKRPPAGK